MFRAPLLLALILTATPALAGEGKLAIHPLAVVDAVDSDAAGLRQIFVEEVGKQSREVVAPEAVSEFLSRHGGSCGGDDTCLAELARATGASRAVLITLAPYLPRLIVSSKIVTANGSVRTTTREFAKTGGLSHAVRNALKRFLSELDVDLTAPLVEPLVASNPPEHPPEAMPAPPPTPEVVPAPPAPPPTPTALAPPTENPPPQANDATEGSLSGWRIASYACLGVAAAAAIGAGVVAQQSGGDQVLLGAFLDDNGQLPAGNGTAAQLQRSLHQNSGIATAFVVTMIVTATAGGTLYVAMPARTPNVALAPTDHGGTVVFSGTF